MSQQSLMQASVRAVTSTTLTYEGDWHALFDSLSIASGPFEGRLLAYINLKLGASYTEINGAMAALAADAGATTFQAIGTYTVSVIDAPVLTWVSDPDVVVAVFGITIPSDVPSGYKIQGEASLTSGGAAFETVSAVIAAGDLTDLQIDDFAFAAFDDGATVYVRVRILTDADVAASNWSNIVSETIDLGGTPTFYIYGF